MKWCEWIEQIQGKQIFVLMEVIPTCQNLVISFVLFCARKLENNITLHCSYFTTFFLITVSE